MELVGRRADGGLARAEVPELDDCVVGAGPGADLELSLPGLEARHLRLVRDGGRIVAHDLGGGLRVNGRPTVLSPVRHLDVLALGSTRLVLLVEEQGPERRRGVCSAWLRVESGGARVALVPGENVCGRAVDAHVVLADPTASKRHARVIRGFDAVTVEDLGSANGTRVNGALVSHARLEDGDRLAFGAAAYRVELEEGDREITLPPRGPAATPSLDAELLAAQTTAFAPVAPGVGSEDA